MLSKGEMDMDVPGLKAAVKDQAKHVKKEEDYDRIEAELLKKFAAHQLEEKPTEPRETGEAQYAKS